MKLSIIQFILTKLKSGLGIVQDTDTATQAIAKGKYVFWKGRLKKASSAISQNDTLSASNLGDVTGGALNELADHIVQYEQIQDLSSNLSWNTTNVKAAPWEMKCYVRSGIATVFIAYLVPKVTGSNINPLISGLPKCKSQVTATWGGADAGANAVLVPSGQGFWIGTGNTSLSGHITNTDRPVWITLVYMVDDA